jgi:hypothetical protein
MNGLLLSNAIAFGLLFVMWSKKSFADLIIKVTIGTLFVLNVIHLVKGS